MKDVNLKLLYAFLMVAETGSFRLAAERCGRTPSAITMQIKQLEQQLGLALFYRSTRKVELTSEGEKLLYYARKALAEIGAGVREIRDAADGQRGRVTVACTPSIARMNIPKLLAQFQRSHPQILIELREESSLSVTESVRSKDVAVGIGPKLETHSDLDYQLLFQDKVVVLAPRNSEIGEEGSLSLADVSELPNIIVKRSGVIFQALTMALRPLGRALDLQHDLMSTETIVGMVEEGLGVALVANHSVPEYALKTLRAIPVSDLTIPWDINLILLKQHALSPAAMHFYNFVLDHFGESMSARAHASSNPGRHKTSFASQGRVVGLSA